MKKGKNIENPIMFLLLIDMLGLLALMVELIYFSVTDF